MTRRGPDDQGFHSDGDMAMGVRLNFAARFYILGWPWKAAKAFYNWAAPFYAPRFLRISDVPPSDPQPQMLTGDTVFAVRRKPQS